MYALRILNVPQFGNPCLKPIKNIAKNLQHTKQRPHLQKTFPTLLLIFYRQPPNLKVLLTFASLPNNFTTGTFSCKSPTCHFCSNINTNLTIIGPNRISTKAFRNFNDNSFNVIYIISCNLCPKAIYIRKTCNSIRQRMNGHRSDIKQNRNKPVAEHLINRITR